MVGSERVLLIKGESGLGNRLLSLLSGLEYARLSGRTPFVEWCDWQYSDGGENVFFQVFKETERLRPACDLPASLEVTPAVWQNDLMGSPFSKIAPVEKVKRSAFLTALSLLLKKIKGSAFSFTFPWSYRKVCMDLSRIDQPEKIGVFFSFTQKFWQLRRLYRQAHDPMLQKNDNQKLREVFERELILKDDLAVEVDAAKQRLLTKKTIGVHLRYTDRKASLKRALSDIEKARKAHPRWALFLATDSQDVENVLREKYPDVLVMEKRFSSQGGAIHFDSACLDKRSMTREAIKELLLLASCDHLLYAGHSTFSQLARSLSGLGRASTLDINRRHLINRLVLFLHRVC